VYLLLEPTGLTRTVAGEKSMNFCFETSRLLDAPGRFRRGKMVPEEGSQSSDKALLLKQFSSDHFSISTNVT
jgi:hypothetical protein